MPTMNGSGQWRMFRWGKTMKGLSCFSTVLPATALFCTVAVAQEPKQCTTERTKIVGGNTARLKEWPGQAALRIAPSPEVVASYFCGGAVISERWVLTAA